MLVLQTVPAGLHGVLDHAVEVGPVHGVKDVREPLAVHVVPVALVGQAAQDLLLASGKLQHVLNRKTFDLGHGGDQDLLPLDVL